MRLIPIFILCALTACMPAPKSQVTKNYPAEGSIGTALSAMQGLMPSRGGIAQRSNAEIAQDFLDLEFRMESGRALAALTRFDGPITVAFSGDVPATANAEFARLVSRFQTESGLDIRPARPGEQAAIIIEFQPRAQLQRIVPSAACFVVPGVRSFAEYKAKRNTSNVDWTTLSQRTQAAIFVPSDTSPQEVRDCLNEELAQAMGPLNDLYQLTDSVFNDDNFNSVLTGFDMLILRMHYAPELRNGMTEAEVAKRLPALLARLNPAGEGISGAPGRLSPRIWISAVETAFGTGGSAASRGAAAERMLSVAMAQGWRDGRLAFSYYAIGRTNVARDPKAAVEAFVAAGRIYRSIPKGAIQAAHVDMQLAAIALAAGQNAQVLDFAERAIPVVRKAENAALLATLMLIKAEALDNLGQTAAARALRLDSLGWARYGFGSEQQVRARMSEIASLGANGLRG